MSFEEWKKGNAQPSGFEAWKQESPGFDAWQAENAAPEPKPKQKSLKEMSPREMATSMQDQSLWRSSDKPIEPGQGTFPQKLEGAIVKGLSSIGRAAAYAPLHVAERVKRISKTSYTGPSYMPAGYKQPDKTKTTEAISAVKNWYEDVLNKQDTSLEQMYERHPEWESEPPKNFADLLSSPDKLALAVAETTPLLVAAGLATAAGAPSVGYAIIFTSEGQSAHDQAKAAGQSDDMAADAYVMYGSVATIIEGMQLKGLIKVGKGSRNAILKNAVGKLGAVKKLAPKLIKEAVSQAVEEQAQGSWGEATAYLLYGEVPAGGIKGFVDRRAQEGLIAATMAGGVSVLGSSAGKVEQLSDKNKAVLQRAEQIAAEIEKDDSRTPEEKAALLHTLSQTAKAAMEEEVPDTATPAEQLDAAEAKKTSQEELLEKSRIQQQETYDELIELAQEGDEVAAQKIQEMKGIDKFTPEQQKQYDELLEQVQEGDPEAAQKIADMTTDEQKAEDSLPTFEVLFESMMAGDEHARTAIENGEYKGAREAVRELEPATEEQREEQDIINQYLLEHGASKGAVPARKEAYLDTRDEELVKRLNAGESAVPSMRRSTISPHMLSAQDAILTGEKFGYHPDDIAAFLQRSYVDQKTSRGRTPVDASIPASDQQARNIGTVKVHTLAKVLGMSKTDRQKIQLDLTGKKSLKDADLAEVKKVEDYFVAEMKKRGLSASTGVELAEIIRANSTQKSVQEMSGIKPAAWKRILGAPGKRIGQFFAQCKRVERMLEALDGFTEGPIYNSIWKVTQTQMVNSRVSHNVRVGKFRDALVDIMTPELNSEEGLAAASEMIQAEQIADGKKAKKLGRKALRKLVGDSLWAKYVTGGKDVILEATDVDPELSLSASERIGMYLAMKNENSLLHLKAGNLAVFTNPDLAMIAVLDAMSKQEKQIADWILTDLEANFSRADQAARMGLGRELTQHDNYFPIRVIDVADMQQEDFLSQLEDKPRKADAKIEPAETKARKHGAQQPLNLDSFEVYLNHLTRIEQFIHMAPVAKSVGSILNTKEFRQSLNNTTSGNGAGILDRWFKNCIRGHAIEQVNNSMAKMMLWTRQKGVLFSLAGNIPSVVRQFLSGFNAVASHPTILAYAAGYMVDSSNPKTYKLLEQRMLDKSDVIKTRSFERELANVKHQAQAARTLAGKKEFSEIALSWQKWADKRTVTIAWSSFYDAALNSESVQKQFELDGSEESAVAYANKMIARTQPMGDVEHLPDMFTGGPIARLLSTFQNQVNNNYNFWAHDIVGMRKAGKISNKMVAYRALFSNILPAMMFGAISRGGLPDDWGDVMFDMVVYNLGPLMLAGRLITDAMLSFGGGKTSVEDILPANFSKTVQAGIKLAAADTGEERTKQLKRVGLYGTKTFGGLTGLVPNQAIRTGQGINALATGETDDLRRLIYSDWSLTKYGWTTSAEEKAREKEEATWMKR